MPTTEDERKATQQEIDHLKADRKGLRDEIIRANDKVRQKDIVIGNLRERIKRAKEYLDE